MRWSNRKTHWLVNSSQTASRRFRSDPDTCSDVVLASVADTTSVQWPSWRHDIMACFRNVDQLCIVYLQRCCGLLFTLSREGLSATQNVVTLGRRIIDTTVTLALVLPFAVSGLGLGLRPCRGLPDIEFFNSTVYFISFWFPDDYVTSMDHISHTAYPMYCAYCDPMITEIAVLDLPKLAKIHRFQLLIKYPAPPYRKGVMESLHGLTTASSLKLVTSIVTLALVLSSLALDFSSGLVADSQILNFNSTVFFLVDGWLRDQYGLHSAQHEPVMT